MRFIILALFTLPLAATFGGADTTKSLLPRAWSELPVASAACCPGPCDPECKCQRTGVCICDPLSRANEVAPAKPKPKARPKAKAKPKARASTRIVYKTVCEGGYCRLVPVEVPAQATRPQPTIHGQPTYSEAVSYSYSTQYADPGDGGGAVTTGQARGGCRLCRQGAGLRGFGLFRCRR